MKKNKQIGYSWLKSIGVPIGTDGSAGPLTPMDVAHLGALVAKVKRVQDHNDELVAAERYDRKIKDNPDIALVLGHRWEWEKAEVQRIKEKRGKQCRTPYLKVT